MPSIEIKLAGKVLEKVVLSEGRTRIGRSPDNDIVLKNPAVSKSHAVLESTPEGTIIRDLGSINGTFVNELPVSEETYFCCITQYLVLGVFSVINVT